MAAAEKQAVTGAGPFNGVLTWVDKRFPLMSLWREHLSEYYAPKNFKDRKSTRLNSSHSDRSRMPSSA